MRNGIAICGALAGLIISMSVAQASDVWVQQAHGTMPAGTPAELNKAVKPTPEAGTATTAAAGSPTTPVTCNQQNASSPACYSATQQTKGK